MKAKIAELIQQAVAAYLQSLGLAPPESLDCTIQLPKNPAHGDFATQAAFALARHLKRPPIEIARGLAAHWPPSDLVASVEAAPPGFLNIRLRSSGMANALRTVLTQGAEYGRSRMGEGKTAQVEFLSANPTGPLHIGHARNAIAGDTLARILAAAGYTVTREYYFNDAGNQMRNLGESLRVRYLQALGHDAQLPEDGYFGNYLVDIAARLRAEHGDSLAESADVDFFTAYAVQHILKLIEEDLRALDIHFDVWTTETAMYREGRVESVLRRLRERGFVYDHDGAVWLRSTAFGDEKDRVLIKSDGSMTYLVPDIAYHDQKLERGFDLIVDLFGSDHHGYVPRLRGAIEALGYDASRVRWRLYQMVTLLRSGVQTKLSKRAGEIVTIQQMVAELGRDVVRFFFLMRELDSHLVFDWDLALKADWTENPVYYVQYAHARICSIFEKAASLGFTWEGLEASPLDRLTLPEEQALIKEMTRFGDVVERAARDLEPHGITLYLRELAATFHNYFTRGTRDPDSRVIQPEDPGLMQARMALIAAVRIVLRNGFALLGISAPEKMERQAAAPEC
ncbi:MAG: arginine--tRNA ligase [Candidatus Sumerlaeia bacterium]|nr:arginine--tRNA ligase [Candidatus Sumerlaeia bacterium]